MRILLHEADTVLRRSLLSFLEGERHEVTESANPSDFENATFDYDFDVYFVNVSEFDGDFLEELKKETAPYVPVIVSFEPSERKFFESLFVKTDFAYVLAKPYTFKEVKKALSHAKKKVVRSDDTNDRDRFIVYRNLTFDTENSIVEMDGYKYSLGELQSKILEMLLASKGKLVPSERLQGLVKGKTKNGTVRLMLHKLREKFGLQLKNVRGRGYILE